MEEKDKNEITIFKEEILKNIHEIERKLTEQINTKNSQISTDYEVIRQKLDSMLKGNSSVIEAYTKQKIQSQKVDELESLVKNIDERLITNEIRTKNYINEFDRVRISYDKIISENLIVPGIVGIGCTFKNLADYIINNLKEMSKIKTDSEILKNEKKTTQAKPDALILKNVNSMLEVNFIKCKGYTDTAAKNIKSIFLLKDKELENMKIKIKDFMKESKAILDGKLNLIEKEISKFQKEKIRNSGNSEKNDDFMKYNEGTIKRIENLEKTMEKYNLDEIKIYGQMGIILNDIQEIKKQLKNNYQKCLEQYKILTEKNNALKNNIQNLENKNINNNVINNDTKINPPENTNTSNKGVYGNSVQKILKKKASTNVKNSLPLLNSNQNINPNFTPIKSVNKESFDNKEFFKKIKEEKKLSEKTNNSKFKKDSNNNIDWSNKQLSMDLSENNDKQKLRNSVNGPIVRNILNRNNDTNNIIKNNNLIEKNNNLEDNDSLEKNKNEKKETISRTAEIIEESSSLSVANENSNKKEKIDEEKEKTPKKFNENDNSEKELNKTSVKEDKEKIEINEINKSNEDIKSFDLFEEENKEKNLEEIKDVNIIQEVKEYKENNSRNNFFTTNLKITKPKIQKSIQTKKEEEPNKKNVYFSVENKKNEYQDFKSVISNNKVNSYKNLNKTNNSKIYINTNNNKITTTKHKTSNSFIKNEDPKITCTEYNTSNINNEIESLKEIFKINKNKNIFKKEDQSLINNITDNSNFLSNEKEMENIYKNFKTSLHKDVPSKHKITHNKLFMSEFNEMNNFSFHKPKEPQTVSKNRVDCYLVNLNNVDMPSKVKSLSEKNSELLDLKKNGLSPPLGGKLPLKPSPAFGRTGYTFYNTKDSGQIINNIENNFSPIKSGEMSVEFIPFSVKNGNNI